MIEEEKVVYGFVYLWRDRKRKMFYLGSHHGNENDKYVCGSKRMIRAYKKRSEDFKRRILQRNYVNDHKLTLEMEDCWLKLIKIEELENRYYNRTKKAIGWPELTQEQRKARAQKAHKTLGPVGERVKMRRANETLGPEGRSVRVRKANETLGSEGRRIRIQRMNETLGPEGRKARARTQKENMGPEGRRIRMKKANETLGPEGRSARSRKTAKTLGSDGCCARALKARDTMGPEGLSTRSRKGWTTRRRNTTDEQ